MLAQLRAGAAAAAMLQRLLVSTTASNFSPPLVCKALAATEALAAVDGGAVEASGDSAHARVGPTCC